ncbi:MAG: alanine racemase [Pseudomonadota bacterium]
MTLSGRLTIDLDAIAGNWRALDAISGQGVETAAAIKADAYGCGADRVGPALARAGARSFFVALPAEGAALRHVLGPGPAIYVLAGFSPADGPVFASASLVPVLNAPEQVADWAAGPAGPAVIQIDTGMNRLGLEAEELSAITPLPGWVTMVMSHLACSDTPENPMNAAQQAEFLRRTAHLAGPRSLAATGGILLGRDYHYDTVRPGIGLFGGLPFAAARPVVTLEIPILQIRKVTPGEAVGYGGVWRAQRPSRIATLSAGYADGLIRLLGTGAATAFVAGSPAPFAGRVSMDLITLDVTDCPEAVPGAMAELLGPSQGIDRLARSANTIGYEILTSLGARYSRRYTG